MEANSVYGSSLQLADGAPRKAMMVQQEQWQLAGSAPEVYERNLVPAIFGPWAPVLIEAAVLKSGDRVLDLACGTGACAAQRSSAPRTFAISGSLPAAALDRAALFIPQAAIEVVRKVSGPGASKRRREEPR